MTVKTNALLTLAAALMLSGCVTSDPEQAVSEEMVSEDSVDAIEESSEVAHDETSEGSVEEVADFGEAGDYTLEDVNTPAPSTAEIEDSASDVIDNESVNFGSAYDTSSPVVNVADEPVMSSEVAEASPVAEPEMSSVAGQYVVIRGDTLSHISQRELGSARRWPGLARRNQLKNPHLIFPGQKITVSPKH